MRKVRFASSAAAVLGLTACAAFSESWQGAVLHEGDGTPRHDESAGSLAGPSAKHRRLEDGGISEYVTDPLIDKPYKHADNRWWIFVHIIVIGYMLLGLNTICDSYFTGALDTMVATWHIKPDVAGATFMAAGGSAPELFTSLIGTTISESDVGFGTIVGSAVFNVLFVIGLCGFAAAMPIKLTWWPLARDCTYYIVSLIILAIFARTGHEIELWEACILFMSYILYCTLMYFNSFFEAKLGLGEKDESSSPPLASPEASLQLGQTVPKLTQVVPVGDTGSTACSSPQNVEVGNTSHPLTAFSEDSRQRHHIRQPQPHFHRPTDGEAGMRRDPSVRSTGRGGTKSTTSHEAAAMKAADPTSSHSNTAPPMGSPPFLVADGTSSQSAKGPQPSEEANQTDNNAIAADILDQDDDDEDDDPDDIEALMEMPDGRFAQIIWIMSLPIYAPLYYLLPKPSSRFFLLTFILSLCWIAGFSFILVYCVELLGQVLHIHVIIMGFTLLAAGTSIPDAVSSVAVARAGEGDMAVSSSIGSNIFDILVGLPIPWIVKIGFIEMAGNGRSFYAVTITSDYIVLYVLILVFMVFCVVLSIHCLGWVLNKVLGAGMAFLYAIFLVTVLIVEFEQPDALKF